MKKIALFFLLIGLLAGCSTPDPVPAPEPSPAPVVTEPNQPSTPAQPTPTKPETPTPETPAPETPEVVQYGNNIFQNITVEKLKDDTFEVKGQARVFEAVLDYVVEDGHNELAKGSVQASAGAPEWGNFNITIPVKKATPNSTLLLILFETSAKDGSRQNELIIPLP